MDFSYYKYLFYINNQGHTTVEDLESAFKLSDEDIKNILDTLIQNGYIWVFKDFMYRPTFKGKHFLQSSFFSFFNINIVDILALIVSVIALFRTF